MDKIKSFDAYFSSRPKNEVAEGLLNKFADLKKKAQGKVAQQAPTEEAPEDETPAATPAKPKLMGKMGAAKAKIAAAKSAQKPQQPQAKKGLLGKLAGKVGATKQQQQQPAANKPSLLKKGLMKKGGLKKTNESAIIVDSDFKVKTVIEIPKALIDSYCKRVKSETGKVATSIFSREELAEEIVKYLVKNNLNAETIPTAIAVGDTEGETQAAPAVDKPQTSIPSDPFADETEEIDIDMDDDDETPMKKGSSAMDFEGKEVEVGEKDSLELDPKQPKNY